MSARRGFALLAALWLLVALSVLSLGLSALTRARRLAAANLVEHVRAEAAARAGVEYLRARLARRLADSTMLLDPWHGVDSVLPDTLSLGGARYVVAARDAGTALNLNRATEDELRRLLSALRIDAGLADRVAQCIVDWRDPGDLHRLRGAERDAYLQGGAPGLPRNGPFQTLSELLSVQGMTAGLYEHVRPYLTLFGSGQVNLNRAERPVLLALPGMTEAAVSVLLRYRRQNKILPRLMDLEHDLPSDARRVLEQHLPELLSQTTTDTREVEVTSEGWLDGSPVRARVTGLLVRARQAVFYVWSRTE